MSEEQAFSEGPGCVAVGPLGPGVAGPVLARGADRWLVLRRQPSSLSLLREEGTHGVVWAEPYVRGVDVDVLLTEVRAWSASAIGALWVQAVWAVQHAGWAPGHGEARLTAEGNVQPVGAQQPEGATLQALAAFLADLTPPSHVHSAWQALLASPSEDLPACLAPDLDQLRQVAAAHSGTDELARAISGAQAGRHPWQGHRFFGFAQQAPQTPPRAVVARIGVLLLFLGLGAGTVLKAPEQPVFVAFSADAAPVAVQCGDRTWSSRTSDLRVPVSKVACTVWVGEGAGRREANVDIGRAGKYRCSSESGDFACRPR